jgi:hypothetical protein
MRGAGNFQGGALLPCLHRTTKLSGIVALLMVLAGFQGSACLLFPRSMHVLLAHACMPAHLLWVTGTSVHGKSFPYFDNCYRNASQSAFDMRLTR